MANKVFVSYKYYDTTVYQDSRLDRIINADRGLFAGTIGHVTPRSYLNELSKVLDGYVIEKWEQDGEDLSYFSDDTIASKLRDKIYDSSVTIVLISPNMKDKNKTEDKQWIPWEISYSLCEYRRNRRYSKTNAVVAIVLPDINNSYDYCIEYDKYCDVSTLKFSNDFCFEIIGSNFFNKKEPRKYNCDICHRVHFRGNDNHYFAYAKWCDFIKNPRKYINLALENREKSDEFIIKKKI